MTHPGRSVLRKYIPDVSANPAALAYRLLTDSNPAARSAVLMALSGLALAPVDAVLARRERGRTAITTPPALPVILVCGPPRSGTTLVARYLIDRLDVAYVNNLASLFPKAPLTANALFGRLARRRSAGDYNAFYGRSRGLSGANDGLFVWDRWLGADRGSVPSGLAPEAQTALPRFFGELQAQSGLPVVNKVNRLFTCADLVAPLLPSATFVCLRRDPLMLAQSLLLARDEIVGERSRPYGIRHENPDDDPLEDVCRQVESYERRIDEQARRLGAERFVVLPYEKFCAAPESLVTALVHRSGGALVPRDPQRADDPNRTFDVSRARRLPPAEFAALERRLGRASDPVR